MMLKTFARSLPLFALLSLSGCGGDPSDSPANSDAAEEAEPQFAGPKYDLKPFQIPKGQTLRITAKTTSSGGQLRLKGGRGEGAGSIRVERDRFIDLISQESDVVENPPLIMKVRENKVTSTVEWKGKTHQFEKKSSLIEIPLLATQNDYGWLIIAEEGTPGDEQAKELDQLTAFQNRNLLPPQPVAEGESWDFDPSFIRQLLTEDMSEGTLKGTMTLLSVKTSPELGCKIASIAMSVVGDGIGDGGEDAKQAAIALDGTLSIELDTFLDRSLEIKGELVSQIETNEGTLIGTLPISVTVEKKILP